MVGSEGEEEREERFLGGGGGGGEKNVVRGEILPDLRGPSEWSDSDISNSGSGG